jgi:hypothetical protein
LDVFVGVVDVDCVIGMVVGIVVGVVDVIKLCRIRSR